jgi:hypothetical protein
VKKIKTTTLISIGDTVWVTFSDDTKKMYNYEFGENLRFKYKGIVIMVTTFGLDTKNVFLIVYSTKYKFHDYQISLSEVKRAKIVLHEKYN